MLEELAEVVAIALRRHDRRRRLHPQHPLVAGRRPQAVRRPDRQDEVVARAVVDRPEDRLERARAGVDEVHLVRLAVAVEPLHRLGRQHDAEGDVRVVEERHATGDPVPGRLQVLRVDQPMPMRARSLVGRLLERDVAHLLDGVRLGRRRVVIEEARPPAEALDAEQLLRVEAAIGLAELGVALVRHLAALEVEHRVHDRMQADTHEGAAAMVIDPSTEKGARVAARLRDEIVAWLVTVTPDGTPGADAGVVLVGRRDAARLLAARQAEAPQHRREPERRRCPADRRAWRRPRRDHGRWRPSTSRHRPPSSSRSTSRSTPARSLASDRTRKSSRPDTRCRSGSVPRGSGPDADQPGLPSRPSTDSSTSYRPKGLTSQASASSCSAAASTWCAADSRRIFVSRVPTSSRCACRKA